MAVGAIAWALLWKMKTPSNRASRAGRSCRSSIYIPVREQPRAAAPGHGGGGTQGGLAETIGARIAEVEDGRVVVERFHHGLMSSGPAREAAQNHPLPGS